MSDFQSYLEKKRLKIDAMLNNCFDNSMYQGKIVHAMKYSLLAGGKRLRPILCIASAEAISGSVPDDVMTAACAIEMIHTYSLIHDDLPSMDNDNLRRGKPTCHIKFDEATAILAGDALQAMAFELLSSIKQNHDIRTKTLIRVIHLISCAAGYQGMVDGQMRDILSEGEQLTLDELEEMHRLKTGRLIEASVITGGMLSGADDKQIEQLKKYAKNIGLAFQITDDILDITGNAAIMGKDTGADNIRNKNTYPSILGLKASKNLAQTLVNNSLQALDIFGKKSDPLRQIATYIIQRKK